METTRFGNDVEDQAPQRKVGEAMLRGLRCRCPNCGEGAMFKSYLRTVENCSVCNEELSHHRADDLPAYLTVVVVGHVVVAAFMAVETVGNLALWQHLAIWIPLTVLLTLLLLNPVKGAVVGLQWAIRMHGFGGQEDQQAIAFAPITPTIPAK